MSDCNGVIMNEVYYSSIKIFSIFRGKPKSLPQLESLPEDLKKHVTLFRKVEDFKKLDNISNSIK